MNRRWITFAGLPLLVFLSMASLAQERSRPEELQASAPSVHPGVPVSPRGTSNQEMLIGAGDLLDISLYGVEDFKAEARVSSNQQISLPMLGAVTVGGLTTDQAQKLIAAKLVEARLYNNPQVTVFVKEYVTQGISVMGEVQKPGIYQLLGARRLYDAISAAGGMTPKAGRYVLVTHRNRPDHPIRVPVSADAQSMANNIPLEPGDTVVVSKAGLVYVVGDVRQPGGFVMENDKNITVLQAIALAQGIGPNPALNAAKLIRKTPAGPQDIPVAIKKILSAKAPDLELQADDIIFIPDSTSKSGAKRGAEAIVQMATGVAVWRFP